MYCDGRDKDTLLKNIYFYVIRGQVWEQTTTLFDPNITFEMWKNKANLNINRFDYIRFQILDKVQGGSTDEEEEEEEEKGFSIIAQGHQSQR